MGRMHFDSRIIKEEIDKLPTPAAKEQFRGALNKEMAKIKELLPKVTKFICSELLDAETTKRMKEDLEFAAEVLATNNRIAMEIGGSLLLTRIGWCKHVGVQFNSEIVLLSILNAMKKDKLIDPEWNFVRLGKAEVFKK